MFLKKNVILLCSLWISHLAMSSDDCITSAHKQRNFKLEMGDNLKSQNAFWKNVTVLCHLWISPLAMSSGDCIPSAHMPSELSALSLIALLYSSVEYTNKILER